MLLPVYGIDRVMSGTNASLTPALWSSIAYLAIFPSIAGYWCWNRAVGLIGARRAGPFLHLSPIFSVLGAVVFINEMFHFYHLVALTMILGGVGIVQYASTVRH
jgi:drug/metabolite transporter (DMT)-like permease